MSRSAIVTVAFGQSTEHLDHTFTSFAMNRGVPLHAFILGDALPQRRLEGVTYHLITPVADFSHPLREVYYRRMELIDQLDVDYALVVDSYDVLCLQPLPSFEKLVGDAALAAVTEHLGCRYILGQGYTANFLNCGVIFWNAPASRDIRREIVARGRSHFRTVADDQYSLNEVVHTKYYERLRILPCQFNYRCHLHVRQRSWPTIHHLDGVLIFHNAAGVAEARKLLPVRAKADLPQLAPDHCPLTAQQIFWRRVRNRLKRHIVK